MTIPAQWTGLEAGVLSVLIGLTDHWLFHNGFGLTWDQALILAGLTFLGGVSVPSPLTKV